MRSDGDKDGTSKDSTDDEEERGHVKAISMQRWQGAPDSGRWVHQSDLPVPLKEKVSLAA